MNQGLDADLARKLLVDYHGWFGPPAIYLGGELIDGRIRMQAAKTLRLQDDRTPKVRATITGDAVHLLCLAGHFDRAKILLPLGIETPDDAAAFCCCHSIDVAPMFSQRPRNCPTMKPRTTPRRRQAIEQIAILYREAREGTGYVSADQIQKVLAPWISKKTVE